MLIQERYRLFKQIAQGGFSKTYLAVDEKQFPPVPCIVQQLSLPQTSKDFEQKAQRLLELGKHPQIPALLAHFEQNNSFYLVQEFIEGSNLSKLVESEGVFSETQIWQLLADFLPVLQFIHSHNVIHRDIKPENIILRTPPPAAPPLSKGGLGGVLFLVDFGAAKLVTAIDYLQTEISVGSPEYAATEQTQGKPVFASDLYSLGVTCIYLLTQISPFDLFDVANDCWVWRQYLTTKVSERLGKIIDKLVEKNLSRRFQLADEVMQAMGIYSSLPTPHSPTPLATTGGTPATQWLLPTPSYHCIHTLTGLSSINSIAMGPDGNILASGNDDKTINFWDLNSKKLLRSFTGHSQAVKSVAFSPDGKILATASDDKTIKLWNVDTFEEICTLLGHKSAVKSVAFSPDGKLLASGSWDKTVKLWDVNTAKEICTLTGHQLQVSAVAFSPDGKLLSSASFDRTIRLWEIDPLQNRPRYTFTGHAWAVLAVAFSPNGKILATGSDDNTIKLWDVNTRQVIRTLRSHSWSVVALTLGADGETLMSGSCDKTVKLWRVSTAEEITICGHVDSVSAVAFNPVAQLLVSGSRDKTIKLWELVQQQGNC